MTIFNSYVLVLLISCFNGQPSWIASLDCGGWHERHATARGQSPPVDDFAGDSQKKMVDSPQKMVDFHRKSPPKNGWFPPLKWKATCKWGRTSSRTPAWPSPKARKTHWKPVNGVVLGIFWWLTQIGVFSYGALLGIMFGGFTNSHTLERLPANSRSSVTLTRQSSVHWVLFWFNIQTMMQVRGLRSMDCWDKWWGTNSTHNSWTLL